MTYSIIQPPFTLKFREMSRPELKAYYAWFLKSIPERIEELQQAINETAGFEGWRADASPESLQPLGAWFVGQVETRPRTAEELETINGNLKFPVEVSNRELTSRTFSLAYDVGMYLSRVFQRRYPQLSWTQPFGSKKSIDYGQPVLAGFGKLAFNPVHMIVTAAYGVIDGSRGAGILRTIYDRWSEYVAPN